ncbi:Sec-independent protein translocase protein TatB [Stutzerimonas kunmingensis]|uniref:Sec-independent protein translocase protein TatB n=1 Tax=Stutzerimonas kunmingensis TaxID=1211807 RepID=UPI000F7B646B|nr:Sec-independent protein translocase protein TatB [Stutzerimonas kunmingensis]MBU0836549.1 Sec-independent protein translocase protein TatB [Gammaproteobacteria bacterium]MBU1804033.1 Sec-independent protein translocase protein TatB [Gammaproteobacteria bacterium]MBU2013920.1 Sec-independent protein translocase protein TatB [Gammaproteobacteria bacterium]RRU76922.1 Sec-independent protein translocase subunit TatB [Stutzerimonas xanthomarina]
MFDIGFTELLLVGLVALMVLGPERLPGAVRTTGLWVGRLKRSFSNIKAEVEREIGADEIRRQLHNERILDLEREMKQSIMPPTSSTSSSTTTPPPTENTASETADSTGAAVTPSPSPEVPPAAPVAEPAPTPRPDRSPEP